MNRVRQLTSLPQSRLSSLRFSSLELRNPVPLRRHFPRLASIGMRCLRISTCCLFPRDLKSTRDAFLRLPKVSRRMLGLAKEMGSRSLKLEERFTAIGSMPVSAEPFSVGYVSCIDVSNMECSGFQPDSLKLCERCR